MPIKVKRKSNVFLPDAKRVIPRYFNMGEFDRIKILIDKIMSMSEEEVLENYGRVIKTFSHKHRDMDKILIQHFIRLTNEHDLGILPKEISYEQSLLIGAYFTMEYSIESAAYFNPSIVEDPHQEDLNDGEHRVILSFRAVGEGHISSIAFVSGVLDAKNELKTLPKKQKFVESPEVVKRHVYEKEAFFCKLKEMKIPKKISDPVKKRLNDKFIYGELLDALEKSSDDSASAKKLSDHDKKVMQTIKWVAESHYEMSFSKKTSPSERVIYPISYSESQGIEDVRFVKFVDDDGEVTYYGTYTAYNGFSILPKMIETKDFYHFKVTPIHGENVQNKGLALFPRKIDGKYVMLTRIDGVNIYIMNSDSVHVWGDVTKILEPKYPWEMIQMGNCGSPHELDEGWLVITHGVGPMRTYSLGAILLDKEDPSKVIGRLAEPFLVPNEKESEGYVPNVVYTCGSIINNGELVLPYAASDTSSTLATVSVKDIINSMTME
ncbi:MAG: glycosidase [Waddliaceae bacterium]|nr:glycosidase [Waddliaceae bacterium]MBT3579401.1 glycosidase [Waddliaceae bacterium]MBT4444621.1 glycosidase [Waddliaceae bacterium]MBT6928751.1 glycosidase [Waddliaceae bacterium]MBT7264219.1 glycosidase [Waddliaceae bacterium]